MYRESENLDKDAANTPTHTTEELSWILATTFLIVLTATAVPVRSLPTDVCLQPRRAPKAEGTTPERLVKLHVFRFLVRVVDSVESLDGLEGDSLVSHGASQKS